MPTDPPAGIDPDTWEEAVQAASHAQVVLLKRFPAPPTQPWNTGAVGFMGAEPREVAEAGLRAALAVLGSGETWTEYGTRWLERKPTSDSDDVRVWGDSREDAVDWRGVLVRHALGSAQSAAGDWDRDGYPNRIEQRTVTAGPWTPVNEGSDTDG